MDLSLKNKTLSLFFTYGVSLELWEKKGMLERELKLYKELGKCFEKIYFITYGKNDGRFQEQLAPYHIVVLPKKYPIFSAKGRSALGGNICYSFLIPFFYKKELQSCDFFKTNQMLGSWSAVIAKWLYKKKLIVRTGYTLSIFSKRAGRIKYVLSKIIEWFAFQSADVAVVATEEEKEYFKKWEKKIQVIPNYVDTELFCPMPELRNREEKTAILAIARLTPQKNIDTLIRSLEGMKNVRLQIIGTGLLETDLKKLANDCGVSVEFLGNRPHEELPKHINYADIFVLPSLYEGNPKVLLEAMACGVPILATDVLGIASVMSHTVDGHLVEPTKEGLQSGVYELISNISYGKRLGEQARQTAENRFGLAHIVTLEQALYV